MPNDCASGSAVSLVRLYSRRVNGGDLRVLERPRQILPRVLSLPGKTSVGRHMAADRCALRVAHEKDHRRLGRAALANANAPAEARAAATRK